MLLKLKVILNFLLEIILPSKCLGCKKRQEILCSDCLDRIDKAERETEKDILALYDYRNPIIKDAIWKLKYYHKGIIGQKLGQVLFIEFLEEIYSLKTFNEGSPIYVIPVPISQERKRSRGYNQTEIIAKSFCNQTDKNVLKIKTNIIFKNKNTIPQAKLTNRNKRLKNIKGAFEIKNREEIKNKIIIIIDDVTTTGGTMLEIINLLKKSGAKKVIGFAVAH